MIYITDNDFSITTETAITLGNFDGLHLGHQELIKTVKSKAARSVVLSFWPHPVAFFKREAFFHILTRDEKRRLLEQMNVDVFIEHPFSKDLAQMSPELFVHEILHKKLKCKFLVVGEDYRFGKAQSGDIQLLKKLCSDLGIALSVVPHIMYSEEKISSSTVRKFIIGGELEKAATCLGRPHFISGTTFDAKDDTFWVDVPDMKLLPEKGSIYGTQLAIDGCMYSARTRITQNQKRTAETKVFRLDRFVDSIRVNILLDSVLN